MRHWFSAGILLLLAAAVSAAPEVITNADAKHPLAGSWVGTMTTEGASEQFAVRFEPQPDGKLTTIFDLPATNILNVPLGPVKRDGDEYVFYEFRAVLKNDGTRLEGSLPFYSRRIEFALTKGKKLDPVPPAAAPAPTAQPRWTFDAGVPIWSSPAFAGSRVYFGSNDGVVHALEAASGRQAWKFATGGAVLARPLITDRHIYIASDDGFVYKLALADQKVVWRFDTHGGEVKRVLPEKGVEGYDHQASSPVLHQGLVYIGSADGHVYAIDDTAGTERWRYKTGGKVRSTAAVADDRIVMASVDGSVYALERSTGKELWKYATGDAVVSSAAIANGLAYIGSRSTDIYALDLRDGQPRWKYFYWMSWVESSPVVHDGGLYVGSSDYQRVYALDAANGKPRWWFDSGGSAWSTPAVTDKTVYIGAVGTVGYMTDHRGGFFALDRATGKARWQVGFPAIEKSFTSGVASSPVVGGGLVYFGGLDGKFYAFAE